MHTFLVISILVHNVHFGIHVQCTCMYSLCLMYMYTQYSMDTCALYTVCSCTCTCIYVHVYILLLYSAQRTHVLDDEHDFFAVDVSSWASPEEKAALQQREKELRERKYGSRKNKTFTLDFAGRKVVEDHSEIGEWAG